MSYVVELRDWNGMLVVRSSRFQTRKLAQVWSRSVENMLDHKTSEIVTDEEPPDILVCHCDVDHLIVRGDPKTK